MEIITKRSNYGFKLTDVSIVHEGTTIKLDSLYDGQETEDFAHHLIDVGFELLPNNGAIFDYLKENGYWNDLKEEIIYELECEELDK